MRLLLAFFSPCLVFAETPRELRFLDELRSKDPEIRMSASEALGGLQRQVGTSPEVLSELKRRLEKGSLEEKVGAAWAFGEIRIFDPETLEFLKDRFRWEMQHGADLLITGALFHSLREVVPQSTLCQLSVTRLASPRK